MRHLMNPLDFTVEELDQLFVLAGDIEKNREKYAHACDGKNNVITYTKAQYLHKNGSTSAKKHAQ